jgi:mono/diheme cytochrome c family protein
MPLQNIPFAQPARAAGICQCIAGVLFFVAAFFTASAAAQNDIKRGQYLAIAGGCQGCHTASGSDAVPFAGGRALKTLFGTFYGPNITPDPVEGLGKWTEADFFRAMRHGERSDGSNYFPAFPYPSFTRITDVDLRDLWAYLQTLPPSSRANKSHELTFPYGFRFLVTVWKWLFFAPGPSTQAQTSPLARGAYLVNALGHCGECHTPRNFLGAPRRERTLAGGKGPEGKRIPNLTPARLKSWSDQDLREFFLSGLTPDGDSAAAPMDEVIQNSTGRLLPADLAAIIAYLRSLPEIPDEPK